VNTRGTTQRPDIILVKGSRVAILDVKCPFPRRERNGESFDAFSDRMNIEKYDVIRSDYRVRYPNATLGTLIIPSAGPIPKRSYLVLLEAGLSKRGALKALLRMSTALIRANAALARSLPPQKLEGHAHSL
jgi:hypothetical protein